MSSSPPIMSETSSTIPSSPNHAPQGVAIPCSSPMLPSSAPILVEFHHLLNIKLNDKNFVLWQQVLVVIKGHPLHNYIDRLATSPVKFLMLEDALQGHVSDAYLVVAHVNA